MENKLIVNNIKLRTWEFFDPEGNSLGFVNEHQFNDLRIQAKQKKIGGYYCLFTGSPYGDIKVEILPTGKCTRWPSGFFDQWEEELRQLIKE